MGSGTTQTFVLCDVAFAVTFDSVLSVTRKPVGASGADIVVDVFIIFASVFFRAIATVRDWAVQATVFPDVFVVGTLKFIFAVACVFYRTGQTLIVLDVLRYWTF